MSLSKEFQERICLPFEYSTLFYVGEYGPLFVESGDALAMVCGAIKHHMTQYPLVSFESNEEKTAWMATFFALAYAEREVRGAA